MGMEPVAHRYIGIASRSTSSILNSELSAKISKNDSGTNTVMRPATMSPTISHLPMSCIISTKAYLSAAIILAPKLFPSLFSCLATVIVLFAAFSSENLAVSRPPVSAVTIAASGRNNANGRPIRE